MTSSFDADADAATVDGVLSAASQALASAGIESPDADAELLLGHALGVTRGRVRALALLGTPLDSQTVNSVRELVRRRVAREPLQHLTGTAHFRNLELLVGPGVFVPRPETEFVAQLAIDAVRSVASPAPLVVDLGTGSGAIALSVATEVPYARVFAVEKDPDAYEWAARNFDRTAASNAELVRGDLTDALPELNGHVAVVVSNPPYIPDDAIPRDAEVRLHDPRLALYGGPDGLDPMRAVSRTSQRLLYPGGTLIVEHGDLQGEPVRDLLTRDGWLAVATHRDLTLRDRAATAVR